MWDDSHRPHITLTHVRNVGKIYVRNKNLLCILSNNFLPWHFPFLPFESSHQHHPQFCFSPFYPSISVLFLFCLCLCAGLPRSSNCFLISPLQECVGMALLSSWSMWFIGLGSETCKLSHLLGLKRRNQSQALAVWANPDLKTTFSKDHHGSNSTLQIEFLCLRCSFSPKYSIQSLYLHRAFLCVC